MSGEVLNHLEDVKRAMNAARRTGLDIDAALTAICDGIDSLCAGVRELAADIAAIDGDPGGEDPF